MKRLLFIILFFSTILYAQQPTWQSYHYLNSFRRGIEIDETLWFSEGYDNIVKYDKRSDNLELLSAKDFGLNFFLKDMMKGRDGQIFFIDGQDGHIIEWKDGVIIHWPDDPQVSGNRLYDFLGETRDGALLIRTIYGQVIRYDKENGASYLHYFPNELDNEIRDGYVSEDGNLLVWAYQYLALFNEEGELLESLSLEDEFIYGAQMDEEGFIWLHTNYKIWHYSPITNAWISMNIEDLNGFSLNKIQILSDHTVLLMSNSQEMIILSPDGQSFHKENINTDVLNNTLPFYNAILGANDTFWYLNSKTNHLNYWKIGSTPSVVLKRPWISTSSVNAITQDKQGKIWLAGNYNIAYQFGGGWNHQTIIDPFLSFQAGGINEIKFTNDNRPIIGVGSLISFGPVQSFVLEWNGQTWDTLHQAVLGLSFFPVIDIEIDQQENLWVLNDFNNFFSVRSNGEWTRFKNTDMPFDVNVFTFLKEGPDGQMWIGTDKGIVTYDGYQFSSIDSTTLLLENTGVEDVCFDDKGQVWVTTTHDGIRKWNGFTWEVLKPREDLNVIAPMGKIIQGVGDEMWITVGWEGVLHFDGQEWEQLTALNSDLVESHVLAIMKDKQDRIWFGGQKSVSVLHPEEQIFTPFELSSTNYLAVYPNPGCCLFRVEWQQDQRADTEIELINVKGQIVEKWYLDNYNQGKHFLDIKQDGLSESTYFIRLIVDGENIKTIPLLIVN